MCIKILNYFIKGFRTGTELRLSRVSFKESISRVGVIILESKVKYVCEEAFGLKIILLWSLLKKTKARISQW